MNGPCSGLHCAKKPFLNSHQNVLIQMQLHEQFSLIVPWIMLTYIKGYGFIKKKRAESSLQNLNSNS